MTKGETTIMTNRTEANPPTTVEIATAEVMDLLSSAITTAHQKHNLNHAARGISFTEAEFRKIIALYLHDKSIGEWASNLGIPNPEKPNAHAI
jgi:hypothetical protein